MGEYGYIKSTNVFAERLFNFRRISSTEQDNGVLRTSRRHECSFFSCKRFLKNDWYGLLVFVFHSANFTRTVSGRKMPSRTNVSWFMDEWKKCILSIRPGVNQRHEKREPGPFRVNGFQNGASEQNNPTQINRLLVFCSYTNLHIMTNESSYDYFSFLSVAILSPSDNN